MVTREKMSIKEVRVEDEGIYTCMHKNPAGQVSHSVRLLLKGRRKNYLKNLIFFSILQSYLLRAKSYVGLKGNS